MKDLLHKLQMWGSRRKRRCGRRPLERLPPAWQDGHLDWSVCCWLGGDDVLVESGSGWLKVHPQSEQWPACWSLSLGLSSMVPSTATVEEQGFHREI